MMTDFYMDTEYIRGNRLAEHSPLPEEKQPYLNDPHVLGPTGQVKNYKTHSENIINLELGISHTDRTLLFWVFVCAIDTEQSHYTVTISNGAPAII